MWRLPQDHVGEDGWRSRAWRSLGSPTDGPTFVGQDVAVARNVDGRLEAALFAGDDGDLWHAWQLRPGQEWSEWHPLDRPPLRMLPPGNPTLARNEDGRLELFTTLGDELWHIWQTSPNNGWSGWRSLGQPGGGLDNPVVAMDRTGRLRLFASSDDGRLWQRVQESPARGPWTPWTELEGPPDGTVTGRPLPSPSSDGRLVLFARYQGDDQSPAIWKLEQTNPDDDWTGRTLPSLVAAFSQQGMVGSPVLAMDGEHRQLLVFPVFETSLYWLRQDRPSGEAWWDAFQRVLPPESA